ncbi:MAG: replication protein [Candidatus Dormibacteraeota bacterium]|nr:replication protein [Candidatus Dormibacteraeota bacterium]
MSATPYNTADVPEPPEHFRGVLESIARHRRLAISETGAAAAGEGSPERASEAVDQVEPLEQDGEPDWTTFEGYWTPHFTQIPDEVFDRHLAFLSGSEVKVLMYVMRRTFGFKRDSDAISLGQLVGGLRSQDGARLDHGVGLSRRGAQLALDGLVTKRLISREHQQSPERGHEPTVYRLRLRP